MAVREIVGGGRVIIELKKRIRYHSLVREVSIFS